MAACRRTIARPRASISSPLTRVTQTRSIISGFSTSSGRGGLTKDDREAARLYKLAADQGDAAAQIQSRGLLRRRPWRAAEGRSRGRAPLQARRRPGITQTRSAISGSSTRRAVAACRRTIARPRASTSSPPTRETRTAQVNLGVFYEAGRGGLPQDDREAARLYKLAADQGNALAQNNLGFFYETGRGGLAKDDREAARLYKLAADQGNALAQGNLGNVLRELRASRRACTKDDREAARLYKLAADQGDASAQNILGFFYERPRRPAEGRSRGRAPLQARRRPGKRLCAGQSRVLLRDWPRRPGEGRSRGRAPLQARRRPGRRLGAEQSRGLLPRRAVAAWRRTTARRRAFTSSPLTRETPWRRPISGSSTSTAVAAWRRTTARPRAFTSSPLTRETPTRRPISGSFTETAVAA